MKPFEQFSLLKHYETITSTNTMETNGAKTEVYKSYSIELDQRNPYGKPEYMFYPTSEGVQHDGDYDDGWKYCGNCMWAPTLEDAKEEIDQLIYEADANLKWDAVTSGFVKPDEV